LQPSFVYRDDSKSAHFRIKYKLKAKILDDSANQKKLDPMMAKKKIIVSVPSFNPKKNISMEECGDVKNLYIFD